ncbi:putative RNA methyltransferase [Gynuella sunshinyii]|uniref:Methylase involved in ubiquinone/menaquinone biosynthesis n=1 Tax=Gynuella sunshinyii YC6258 TaxID=1445510 RepID=A0A0C5VU03_9GAMM|nr:methyltransferase domain-containing protein [Gynuella sunshinyii]AJQ96753.1 methylase involved in ubiquinone/menaquinone biosynthesis [Gynuella sunshinyii YC6258]
MDKTQPVLKCPVCSQPLDNTDFGLACAAPHTFDRAKQGYVNLLMSNHKRSRSPGDDKEMVTARTRFLDLQRYQPLIEAVIHCADKFWPDVQSWVDLGCGEGWYTQRLNEHLDFAKAFGLDISKHAVMAACKRSRQIDWYVASSARTPFMDQSMDAALILFAQLEPQELIRILKPEGSLIIAGAGSDHLLPLRELLYEQVNFNHFDPSTQLAPQFELAYDKEIKFEWIPENDQELYDLLAMTPHNWRVKPEKKEAITELTGKLMTGHFRVQVWELVSSAG